LQQALQQRCGAASARVVATLKQASWQRYGAVASLQQRRRATRWRGGQCSRQRQAALRCSAAMAGGQNFCFVFFLLDSFKERTKARQREMRQGFETCFPALLVGLNVTRKLSLAATVVATCTLSLRSFRQQQHHTSSNNSRTSKVQEICCFQHEATGNRVFLELK
jgi:hypothetical protein